MKNIQGPGGRWRGAGAVWRSGDELDSRGANCHRRCSDMYCSLDSTDSIAKNSIRYTSVEGWVDGETGMGNEMRMVYFRLES